MTDDNTVMTVDEVAAVLRVHPTTIYRLIASGQLHPFKMERGWRFDQVAVAELVRNPGQQLTQKTTRRSF